MRRFFFRVVICIGGLGGSLFGCSRRPASHEEFLRVAVPREPTTWNRLLAADLTTHVVTDQLHAPLIRLNQQTQEMEPALAESWEFSEDGTELVFHLRKGVRFSDGEPFGASDVAFTFRALNDPRVGSPLVDTARIDGEPIVPVVIDLSTVCFHLPRRTAAVERIFDSIRILPEHRLKASLEKGTFVADSGLGAPVDSIVGLGPFRLKDYVPGLRVVLERNPYYWKSGDTVSPRLEGVVFDVVADPRARLLRLRAGEVDFVEHISPEAFRTLRDQALDSLVLEDLGPGLTSERLWFNLNPDSPIPDFKKKWFQDVRFRRAVSLAIDRRALARVVFGGLASPAMGPVSPANRLWRNESIAPTRRDLDEARKLLEAAGFHGSDGRLYDPDGNGVRFALVTNAGDELRLKTGAFLQEDLKEVGIELVLVPLEGSSLFRRVTQSFDYEACLLGITQTDPDPSAEMALWLSRAPFHLWHPAQASPGTAWEARIDALMEAQVTALDREQRRACYDEVQSIVAEELPILDLVVPHVLVGYSERVEGVRATPFGHPFWNSDELRLAPRARSRAVASRDPDH